MPKRAAKLLTQTTIEKYGKPKPGQRREIPDADGNGLCLRITDKGTKSFAVYYRLRRPDGAWALKRMTIGSFPDMTLVDARKEADRIRGQARTGVDPQAAKRAEEAAKAETADRLLFANVAESYITRQKKLKRGKEIESVIRRHLIPAWGESQITALVRLDLSDLTRPLLDADQPAAALKLQEVAKAMMYWAVEEGLIENSPFARMKAAVEKTVRQRDLSHSEMKRLWATCEGTGYPFGPLVQLLMLTGQRRNEVGEMTWDEVDLKAKQWLIPVERSKSKRAHIVPLSAPAVKLLKSLPRYSEGRYIFTTTGGKRPVSGFSKMKARLDKQAEVKDWRIHDIRRTVRSEMARLKVDDIVAERVLNHLPRGLAKIYNQYQYLDEKREALNTWAREFKSITNPTKRKVVKLRRSA